MFAQTVTSSRQTICQQFFQIFTVPTANIFTPLVRGWILCTARRTVAGIVRFAELFIDRPHYAFHRFFSCAIWSVAELWRLLAVILIKTLYPRGVIREGPERAAAMCFSIVRLWYPDN
ncbi:MAG: transposase [Sedimentisphaerales bacterium]|nr:transposase [Sedimentisphaerales bacterium]